MSVLYLAGGVACAAPGKPADAAATPVLKTLYDFKGSADGGFPQAELTALNGQLYGTAPAGGKYFAGAIYRFNPATGVATTLYSFTGAADGSNPFGGLVAAGGLLYGTTGYQNGQFYSGTLFSFNPATGVLTTAVSFTSLGANNPALPSGGLTSYNGAIYGTTLRGGSANAGIVFRYQPATASYATLHNFDSDFSGEDAGSAYAPPIPYGGLLYGTTARTVYSIDPQSGAEQVIYTFTGGADGGNPASPLLAVGTALYGVASGGPNGSGGVVFAINPATGAESTACVLGDKVYLPPAGKIAGLVAEAGLLYGATQGRAASTSAPVAGTLFSCNPASGAVTTLYSFPLGTAANVQAGLYPQAALTALGGVLYGTANGGGQAGSGTVFSFNPASGSFTKLHDFIGVSGIIPVNGQGYSRDDQPGLINVAGTFFGVTPFEGSAGLGSVFSFKPQTGQVTTLYSFPGGGNGYLPQAGLSFAAGTLYGTTYGGDASTDQGSVFALNPKTGAAKILHQFTGPDGANPASPLSLSGKELFGAASALPPFFDLGAFFSVNLKTQSYDKLSTATYPQGGFAEINGALYSTQNGGGLYPGTIVSINKTTGAVSTVYKFQGSGDGQQPAGGLAVIGGKLYGTTVAGGAQGQGSVFVFDPQTGTETVLHSFTGADGSQPQGGLLASGGQLFGTASLGGSHKMGTVFSVAPATGAMNVLYDFQGGGDGGVPNGALISAGKLIYGTNSAGGANNRGTIFSLQP